MSEYNCGHCGRSLGGKKGLDSHVGQVHPETFKWNDEDYIVSEFFEKGRTRGDIADELGCSKATITNALGRFGYDIDIGERRIEYPKLWDGEWLSEQYKENSAPEIAEALGCTPTAVYSSLDRNGIGHGPTHHTPPSGEGHPKWKGGHQQNRGHTWPEQRSKALERDGYECRRCGVSNSEHETEYSQEIHVHHIVRYGAFEDCVRANQLENLITLCRPCHDELEGEPPSVVFSNVKVKGDDPGDVVERLNATIENLQETAGTVRGIQPGDGDE